MIQRYEETENRLVKRVDGDYVLYEDHLTELELAKEEIYRLQLVIHELEHYPPSVGG